MDLKNFDPQAYLDKLDAIAKDCKDRIDERARELRRELESAAESVSEIAGDTDNLKLVAQSSHILLGEIPEDRSDFWGGPGDDVNLEVNGVRHNLAGLAGPKPELEERRGYRAITFLIPKAKRR